MFPGAGETETGFYEAFGDWGFVLIAAALLYSIWWQHKQLKERDHYIAQLERELRETT
jgi:hypothetical protein